MWPVMKRYSLPRSKKTKLKRNTIVPSFLSEKKQQRKKNKRQGNKKMKKKKKEKTKA